MPLTPVALLLLSAQRYALENHPQERELARQWLVTLEEARASHILPVLVQWDGPPENSATDSAEPEHATFSRGWTLYPDFRAEEGDLLIRAGLPDAFASSDLDAQLKARAVRELRILSLPGTPQLAATTAQAEQLGYAVTVL